MDDPFELGVMPRATLQKWASEQFPDIEPFFPFQGPVRFKSYFGPDITVAITDEGKPGTILSGGTAHADDPEIAEVLRVVGRRKSFTFAELVSLLGDKYFSFNRFTYAGPYRGGNEGFDRYSAVLADWVEACVLPRVLELNRARVMRAMSPNESKHMSHQPTYDIAISFAGEDRGLAESISKALKENGVNIFYDDFEKATLWGKDLFQHLQTVYRDKARYCIVLVSAHYQAKRWTNHELKNAQARAFQQGEEYILPIRLDDTELPGMNATTGYIDARRVGVGEMVELVMQKLGKAVSQTEAGVPGGYITLAEAATQLFEALRNTKLGEFYERLTEDSIRMSILDSFASPFVEYSPIRVKRPPSRQWEDYTVERHGQMTAHGDASYLTPLGSPKRQFVEPILRQADADQVIADLVSKSDMNPM